MPRNARIMAVPELIRDMTIRARKNFSSELTVGARVEIELVSSLRAGDETLVPTTTKELGTLALILLIPGKSLSQEKLGDLG